MRIPNRTLTVTILLASLCSLHSMTLLEDDFSDPEGSQVLFPRENTNGAAIVDFEPGGLRMEIPSGAPDYLFVRTDEGAMNDDGAQTIQYKLVFENQSPAESIVSFGFWLRLGDVEFGNGYRLLLYRDPGMSQVGLQRFNDKRPGQPGDQVWLSTPNQFGHFGRSGESVEIEVTVKTTPHAVDLQIVVNGTEVDVSDSSPERITAGQGVGFNLDTNGAPSPATILCQKVTVTTSAK